MLQAAGVCSMAASTACQRLTGKAPCPPASRAYLPAEDALLPVLNKRAHLLLDSYNHLRGPVTAPVNVTAIMAGKGDAGASLGGRCSRIGRLGG